jgi:hypothetical protein
MKYKFYFFFLILFVTNILLGSSQGNNTFDGQFEENPYGRIFRPGRSWYPLCDIILRQLGREDARNNKRRSYRDLAERLIEKEPKLSKLLADNNARLHLGFIQNILAYYDQGYCEETMYHPDSAQQSTCPVLNLTPVRFIEHNGAFVSVAIGPTLMLSPEEFRMRGFVPITPSQRNGQFVLLSK